MDPDENPKYIPVGKVIEEHAKTSIEVARVAMSVHRAGGSAQMVRIAGPGDGVKKKN